MQSTSTWTGWMEFRFSGFQFRNSLTRWGLKPPPFLKPIKMTREEHEKRVHELFKDPVVQELAYALIETHGTDYLMARSFEDLQIDGVKHQESAQIVVENFWRDWAVVKVYLEAHEELRETGYDYDAEFDRVNMED